MPSPKTGKIRIGIGGWTYAPWRGTFYPSDLTQTRELQHASKNLTSIEINGTFYGLQKPASYEKWYQETPEDFVFSLKAPRYATNRKILADANETIERFFASGVLLLKQKLGPINWQFATTKKFDPEDFEAFLKLLPASIEGQKLKHAIEVRNDTFKTPEFIALARKYKVALDAWAERARQLAAGTTPDDLETSAAPPAKNTARDVYLYVISGFKERNPAAAMALIKRLE
jgi:uncharacterized protein YecE (DUF72 family)